jgi:hypothetical protein
MFFRKVFFRFSEASLRHPDNPFPSISDSHISGYEIRCAPWLLSCLALLRLNEHWERHSWAPFDVVPVLQPCRFLAH